MAKKPPFPCQFNVQLAPYTTLKLGGPARAFASAQTEDELIAMVSWADTEGWPVLILGGGSNMVVSDDGFDGLVIRCGLLGQRIESNGTVWVQAGAVWDEVVRATVDAGFAGLECLSGIPGLAGATPIQNVGAYGAEVSELITEVRVYDRAKRRLTSFASRDCQFTYRNSRFKRELNQWVVLSVRFALRPGGAPVIRYPELEQTVLSETKAEEAMVSLSRVRQSVLEIRRSKSMVFDTTDTNHRSVGSFFTNPILPSNVVDELSQRAVSEGWVANVKDIPKYPAGNGYTKLPAAWLIERSGVSKGMRWGGVGVSDKHALALVHHVDGSTTELLELAQTIRQKVLSRFGVILEPEPMLIACSLPALQAYSRSSS